MNYLPIFQKGQTYTEYRNLLDQLLEEGKTTGENHSEAYLRHAGLNIKRMNRLDKRPELSSEITSVFSNLNCPMLWLIITEGWCGDAAQILPIVERLANQSPNVITRYILRDEHPEVMDQFLTDGAEAIPVVVFLDPESGSVLGHWGPRPIEGQEIMKAWKASGSGDYEVVSEQMHTWYAKDKTVSIQKEFSQAVTKAAELEAHQS